MFLCQNRCINAGAPRAARVAEVTMLLWSPTIPFWLQGATGPSCVNEPCSTEVRRAAFLKDSLNTCCVILTVKTLSLQVRAKPQASSQGVSTASCMASTRSPQVCTRTWTKESDWRSWERHCTRQRLQRSALTSNPALQWPEPCWLSAELHMALNPRSSPTPISLSSPLLSCPLSTDLTWMNLSSYTWTQFTWRPTIQCYVSLKMTDLWGSVNFLTLIWLRG